MPKLGWWISLTPERRNELNTLLLDKSIRHEDIAKEFSVDKKQISNYALRVLGVEPRNHRANGNSQTKVLSTTELEYQRAVAEEAAAKERVAKLKAKLDELKITLEDSGGGMVTLFGVGPAPLQAHRVDWLRWLNSEGARKLREFCTTKN